MILVLSGTEDGKNIVRLLENDGWAVVASVATVMEAAIYAEGNVITGSMGYKRAVDFIKKHGVDGVVDATHTLSSNVSHGVMEAAKNCKIPYIRYGKRFNVDYSEYDNVIEYENMEDFYEYLQLNRGNVMFSLDLATLGEVIAPIEDKSYLYVGVIRGADNDLDKLLKFGLPIPNVLELHGLGSEEENYSTYKKHNIKTVVVKYTGGIGGIVDKINAAKRAGANVLILNTESIMYPCFCTTYNGVLDETRTWRSVETRKSGRTT